MKVREASGSSKTTAGILTATRGSHRQFKASAQARLVTIAGNPTTTLRPAQKQYPETVRTEMSRYLVIIEKTTWVFRRFAGFAGLLSPPAVSRQEVEREMHDA